MTKFGFLSKLNFLQDFASFLIARTNPAIVHNVEKYQAIKKAMYLSFIEAVDGDYLEFGVFTGSSFTHAMRCARAGERFLPQGKTMPRFFGFDSFSGFGELSEDDIHPFYQDENFTTSYDTVNQRARKAAKSLQYQLVPGFFSESLKDGPEKFGLTNARIVFVDSDTYSSSLEALTFCLPLIQEGTIIILDDYFSYRGSRKHGVAAAFSQIVEQGKLDVRQLMTYGYGGSLFCRCCRGPQMKLSVVIPCYNEAENLNLLIPRCRALADEIGAEVVLVDNGSGDASPDILKEMLSGDSLVRSVRVEVNKGYGHGILAGLSAATGDVLAWTHADMQTDPMDLATGFRLFQKAQDHTGLFVKGQRYGRPWSDTFFTIGMSVFETLLLRVSLWDINAQPTMFSRSFFENWQQAPGDFSLDLFAYYQAKRAGLRVERFPVRFGERAFGVSHWNIDWRSKRKFIHRTVSYSRELKRQISQAS